MVSMKKWNYVVTTLLVVVIVGLFTVMAMAAGGSTEKIVLKLAHNGTAEHAFQFGYMKFEEILEKEAPGRFEVQIFPSEQLGPDENCSELVKMGSIAGNAANAAAFVPEADIFNFPFIFKDLDHFYRVLDGAPGERVARAIEDKLNCVVLGYFFSGIRNEWNKKRPVLVPKDLVGLKIRTLGSPIFIDTFNALGAQATPMSFGEVYTAIQQGVIDGAETDHVDLLIEKFYEVTKYVSLTGHIYLAIPFIFSEAILNKLTDDEKELIIEAGKEAVSYQREVMEQQEVDARKKLESEHGIKFFDVDVSLFQEATKPIYAKYADSVGGLGYIEEIINY